MNMNLPNKLTILRVILIPFFVFFMMAPYFEGYGNYIAVAIFIVASLTDMLDGKIARKYGLVTDFGKFIDPLADKFMVIGSMLAILANMFIGKTWADSKSDIVMGLVFIWVVLIILFRELAVTSMRLVVAGNGIKVDLAANMFGKLKTVSQMVGTVVIIIEPLIPFFCDNHILSYVCMAVMAISTIGSGIIYFKGYLPYINTNK